jgi:cytochrome c-type biogenesis protein CcmH
MRAHLVRCRFALLLGLLLALVGVPTLAVDPTELPDPALQARYRALTHELRCMQCQNQSIADSPVGLAADLRREVRDMLLAGKSDAEIREFMVARYGDFILFRPRLSPRTAWLWAAPGILLVVGAIVAARIVRRRSALAATDDELIEEEEGASR